MAAICPRCGSANRAAARFCLKCVTALPTTPAPTDDTPFPATEFVERAVVPIGEGGFGIVYLAWDAALERQVAIKEYMPTSLASRGIASHDVTTRSDAHRVTFEAGLKSFVNESRLLARFDHPALVKVFRFWEANRTAYMAMPYYEGPTLKAALARQHGRVPEAQLRTWLGPLLDALAALHAENCFHRDVSPDNILLTASGPLLLDFGAARRVIGDRTQALTTMLKPGFAPIEQYGGDTQQGPWTDLYALAGVVHYAITGRTPLASVARMVEDTHLPLATSHAGHYARSFLLAIDAALSLRPEARPQSVAQFRALLDGAKAAGAMPAAPIARPAARANTHDAAVPPAAAPRRQRATAMYGAAAVLTLAIGIGAWTLGNGGSAVATVHPSVAAPAKPPRPTQASEPAVAAAVAPIPAMPEVRRPIVPAPLATASSARAPEPALVESSKPRAAARTKATPAPVMATERVKPAAAVAVVQEFRHPVRTEPEVVSYTERSKPPRCGDLILKSSLEVLNPEEVVFLKNRCR
jgi:hypothetical protein